MPKAERQGQGQEVIYFYTRPPRVGGRDALAPSCSAFSGARGSFRRAGVPVGSVICFASVDRLSFALVCVVAIAAGVLLVVFVFRSFLRHTGAFFGRFCRCLAMPVHLVLGAFLR